MANFSILLSPSAEKTSGGNPFAPDMFDYRSSNTFNYFHELNPERRQLINLLQDAIESEQDVGQILGQVQPRYSVHFDELPDAAHGCAASAP